MPSVFPPIVTAPLFALWIGWMALALGYRLAKVFGFKPVGLNTWEKGFVFVALGMGTLQLVPLGLAAFHMMTPAAVRTATLLLCAALAWDLWAVAKHGYRVASSLRGLHPPKLVLAWGGLLGILLLGLLAHALAFGAFGDDDGYHLSAPARWLREGTLVYLPTYTVTNASMGFEMLYVMALAFGQALGAKALHFGAGLLFLGALHCSARRLAGEVAGLITISLLLIPNPIVNVPQIFGLAFVDFPACLTAVVGVFVWLAWRDSGDRALLVCLALLAGFTGSFKTTAISIGIFWGLVIAIDLAKQGVPWAKVLRTLALFGACVAVPVLPWLVRNWAVTSNPLYPMASSILPTRDWSPELAALFGKYVRYYSWGVASGARLTELDRKLILAATCAAVLAIGALLYWRAREPALRLLTILATCYTLFCVALTGLLFRYWLPGVICFALVASALLAKSRLKSTQQLGLAVALLGVALVAQLRAERVFPGKLQADFRVATGLSQPDSEMANNPLWQFWLRTKAATPADARVLVGAFYTTFGSSSFGCFPIDRVCFTTDSHLQQYIRLDDWSMFLQSVANAKIEYLILSDTQFSAGRHGFSFKAGDNEYPFCARLAAEFGDRIVSSGPFGLYRLRSTTSASKSAQFLRHESFQ